MAGRHRKAGASNPRRVFAILFSATAIAAAWVVGGVSGFGGSYAAWSSSVTLPGATLHTGTASLTLGGFDQLGATFTTSALTTDVDKVTVTNSGTVALRSFTTSVSLSGSSALAGAVSVSIWPLSGTACGTAPSSAATGNWSNPPTWLANQALIAAGNTVTYCVSSSISQAALLQNPGATVTPTVSVTGWTGTTKTGWSTGAQSAKPFTLTDNSGWVSVSPPSQVGISTGSSTSVAVREQVGGNGTTSRPGYICLDIQVTPTGHNNDDWTLTVDTTKAPFKSTPDPDDWVLAYNDGGSIRYTQSRNGSTVTLTGTDRGTQDFQICMKQTS